MQVEAHSIHFLNCYFKPLVVKFLQSQADQRALESARLLAAHRNLFKHVMDSSDDEDSQSDLSCFAPSKRMRL